MDDFITPEHPLWKTFIQTLEGPDGCNIRNDGTVAHCKGGSDKTHARQILKVMGFNNEQVDQSCEFFDKNHGPCDCSIAINVAEYFYETERERKRISRLEHKIKLRSYKRRCYD